MIGALARRKLEGEELAAYLESERKLNQDMAHLVTGAENLQSPAPPRRSQRLRETTTEKAPTQAELAPDPNADNPKGAAKQPATGAARARAPPKPPAGNPPAGAPVAGPKPPPGPDPNSGNWCGIQKGRTPGDIGVYNSFEEVQAATWGVEGAIYQAFATMEEAQAFVDQSFNSLPKPGRATKRWFALLSGDRPSDTGVYETWEEVGPRIQHNPNPIYQSFPNQSLAEAYLMQHQTYPRYNHMQRPVPYPAAAPARQHPAPVPPSVQAPQGPPPPVGTYPAPTGASAGYFYAPQWHPNPGAPGPSVHPPGTAAPPGPRPWTAQPAPPGTYPFQAPPVLPAQPHLFHTHDESAGDSHRLFGIDARDVQTMMTRFGVPGLPPEGERRLANQVLDAVGLPGASAPSAEETSLSRLAEGISSIATGGLVGEGSSAGGLIDTGWKSIKRNTIGTINSHQVLYKKTKTLQSQKQVVLSQTLSNLAMTIHHYAGYSYQHAKQLAAESMYYRISRDNYEGYLSLHVDLLTQCADASFPEVKAQIEYHSEKLLEIRGLYSVRLQMIAHHYIYFRDGMAKGWQSLGMQKIALLSLRGASALENPESKSSSASGSGGRKVCSHCKTGLHAGNKSKCPWKALGAKEAKEAGAATLQNLGIDPDGEEV